MDPPFQAMAEALFDLTVWETHRLDFLHESGLCGRAEPMSDRQLARLRRRLAHLQAAAALLTVLVAHEDSVRALDPALARLIEAIKPAPSLWDAPADPLGR